MAHGADEKSLNNLCKTSIAIHNIFINVKYELVKTWVTLSILTSVRYRYSSSFFSFAIPER